MIDVISLVQYKKAAEKKLASIRRESRNPNPNGVWNRDEIAAMNLVIIELADELIKLREGK